MRFSSSRAHGKRIDPTSSVLGYHGSRRVRVMRHTPGSTERNQGAMSEILLYAAAALTAIWGIAHLFATRGVVAGFGEITPDNRRIITMEWIVEGVALISTATFVVAVTATDPTATISIVVYMVATTTLLVLAVVSLFTGFRVAFLPFRLCPFIFGLSAFLIALGTWL